LLAVNKDDDASTAAPTGKEALSLMPAVPKLRVTMAGYE
jgi:hypothetical protein